MPKAKTDSFVAEFEVRTNSKERRVLESRFEAARHIYNAILGEALSRMRRMKADPDFDKAKAMPRGAFGPQAAASQKAQAKARRTAFEALRSKYGFLEYDMHKHSSLSAACWLRGHLDSQAAQVVASRAFRAVEQYCFGKGGRPNFKQYGEIDSLEGKTNAGGIRYRSEHILWDREFAKLDLHLVVKPDDQVQAHALGLASEGKVKFVRLLTRAIRKQNRIYAQLVLEGQPLVKLTAKSQPRHPVAVGGIGGMDLGPSKVAFVSPGHVEVFPFCEGLDRKSEEIRRYQRWIDRQRRTKNSGNYNPNGTVRKGPKTWDKSERQRRNDAIVANLCRAMAAQRTSLQNSLAHQVLALANNLLTEKVNKRDWAREYGRSVGHKAPAAFEDRVGLLAKASGGQFELVNTYRTCLSSRCLCGLKKKKPRKERKHICGCQWVPEGTYVDRDEFSAFLVLFSQGSALDEGRAREAWSEWGADSLLRLASKNCEVATGKALLTHRAREVRKSDSTDHRSGQRRENGPIRGRRAPGVSKPLEDLSNPGKGLPAA